MAKERVGKHARDHRFADGHSANADTGIVSAFGDDVGLVARARNRLTRRQDRRGRLDCEARDDRLARRDAAEHAARMIGAELRVLV